MNRICATMLLCKLKIVDARNFSCTSFHQKHFSIGKQSFNWQRIPPCMETSTAANRFLLMEYLRHNAKNGVGSRIQISIDLRITE